MSKNKKQTIKCDVDSCKHNDNHNKKCELEKIKVSSTYDTDNCENVEDTICDSFEKNFERDDEYQEELEEIDEEFENSEDEEFEIEEYVEIIESEKE